MIYFTSDTHFGQERTLVLSKRPFTSVEEMDRIMIANWNSIVKHDNIVFHLGDFGNYEVAKQLNGDIYLILGNYERKDIEEGKISIDELQYKYGFKVIGDEDIYKLPEKLRLLDPTAEPLNIQLQHEPSKCDKNMFNLFGHIHGRQMVKRFGLDVGVDCHHFKPVSFKDVLFYKEAIEKHYDEEVFL